MKQVVVLGAAGILVFDIAWSTIFVLFPGAERSMTPAVTVVWGLMCVALGFILARQASVARAAAGTAVVGLIDATLGWAISWAIGPGRWTVEELTAGGTWPIWATLTRTIVFVVAMYAALGLLGALASRTVRATWRARRTAD